MKHLTITNGFAKMADATLELRANQIHLALDGNPHFVNPTPALPALADAIAAFAAALADCRYADRLQLAIKNQKREELITLLHKLGDFVLFKSDGDPVIAASSGFSVGKQPAPAPPITSPENLQVKAGYNTGELLTKINRVKGALVYLYQYATDTMMENDNWKVIVCSRTRCIISNLPPGTKYNCRVAAIGPKDQLMYSDIVSRYVA